MNELMLGATKLDITPSHSVPLAGFASRNKAPFDRVESRLYAKLFYIRQDAEPGEEAVQILLVSVDLLNVEQALANRIRENIAARWAIPYKDIILTATHTHSGPATMAGVAIGEPDRAYLTFLEHTIVDGVQYAISNAEVVNVQRGVDNAPYAVNRRYKEEDGSFVIAPNLEGLTDKQFSVVRFVTREGKNKAIWLHYACHPVNMTGNSVSSEFCGHACESLERKLGEEVIVGFLQGTCGDINPYLAEGARELQAAWEIGEHLANLAHSLIESGSVEEPNVVLRSSHTTAELPYRNVPTMAELELMVNRGEGLDKAWATFMLQHPERLKPSAIFEATRLHLSDHLSLLFMNGEIVVHFGLFAKQLAAGVMPVGYSNGMAGYITTEKQLEEGGYEPIFSTRYLGLPSPFDHTTESIVMASIQAIMSEQ